MAGSPVDSWVLLALALVITLAASGRLDWMGWKIAARMLDPAHSGHAQVRLAMEPPNPARCEVCGQPRRLCPRCGYLDAGLPSPVGCSGRRW